MHIACINYYYDREIRDPDEILSRYRTQTEWCAALQAQGARVTVLQRFGSEVIKELEGVEYRFVPDPAVRFGHPLDFAPRMNQAAAAVRPDVVHVQGMGFAVQAARLKRRLPNTPILIQDHADRPARRALVRNAIRAALRSIDAVSFTVPDQAEPWRKAGLLSRGTQVAYLPESSCPFQLQPSEATRALTGLCGAPQCLWVGRLNANKDPLTVLAGFALAVESLPDARLAMVYSDTTLLPQVRTWLKAHPTVAERVLLLGQVPYRNLEPIYNSADIFLLGSDYDGGTGYSLLEALACGVTPAVTTLPSFTAITEGIGFHWPPGSAAECAAAIVNAWKARDKRRRDQIRAHFDACLSPETVARRALAVYRMLAAGCTP
jgi:glycosyltransferase involved in cell wall biosynthesis